MKKTNLKNGLIISILYVIYIFAIEKVLHIGYFEWDDKAFLFDSIIKSKNFFEVFSTSHYGLYHPITTIWVKLTFSLFQNSPLALHIISVLFHLSISFLVFLLIREFNVINEIAILGFAMFLFHPLTLEVVLWLTSIKDLLMTAFSLLSIIFYINFIKKDKLTLFWISQMFFTLAVLSKPQAIVLPIVFFLLDLFFKKKFKISSLVNKVPMIILSFLVLFVNFYIRNNFYDSSYKTHFSFFQNLILSIKAISLYISDFLVPIKLSIFYPVKYFKSQANVYLWIWFLIILLVSVYFIYKKKREYIILWLIVFAFLIPVIRIIPIGESLVNNRYTYSALAFFVLLLAVAINNSYYKFSNYARVFVFVIISIVFLNNSFVFFQRKQDWRTSNIELFKSDFNKFPDSEILANSVGSIYYHSQLYDSAQYYFNKAIELDPSYFKAMYNLGLNFEKKNDIKNAIISYKKALEISPKFSKPLISLLPLLFNNENFNEMVFYYEHFNGNMIKNDIIYNLMGKVYYSKNDINNSIKCFSSAVNINSENSEYLYNLAVSYGKQHNYVKSILILNKAISINQGFDKAYILRGLALVHLNRDGCNDFIIAYNLGNYQGKILFDKYCQKLNP